MGLQYRFMFTHQDGGSKHSVFGEIIGEDEVPAYAQKLHSTISKEDDWLPSGWSKWTAQIAGHNDEELLCLRFLKSPGPPRWFVQGPPWPTRWHADARS